MKTYAPLELVGNQRVLEQNREFTWVVSVSMFVNLATGKVELMHDCISPMMESMGDAPKLDQGMPKPQAEWLINGCYFSPMGQPVTAAQAVAKVAENHKSLDIFGDRSWVAGIPSSPSQITEMPIDYQHAFGSAEFEGNPDGLGYMQDDLPNIESSAFSITDKKKDYTPAGFAPLDENLPQRKRYSGTYDDKYMEKYFPGYPADLDWRFFMNAPSDQWFDGFLQGDEPYEFTNLHPVKSEISGNLPGFKPRCFIRFNADPKVDAKFEEISMNLDTAWFFPDKEIVQLIWRGGKKVLDDDADEITHMVLGYEHQSDPKRTVEQYRRSMDRRIEAKNPMDDSLNTADLIPLGAPTALKKLMDSALGNSQPSELSNNMEAKSSAIKDAVNDELEKSIAEIKEKAEQSGIPDAERKKILDKINSLGQAQGSDADVDDLMAKIGTLIPGIESGDPSKLDLSEFSFDKIDKIFELIAKFTSGKREEIIAQVKEQSSSVIDDSKQTLAESGLELEKTEMVENQLANLDGILSGELTEKVALPRLDIESLKQHANINSPELAKAKKDLHLRLSNPMMTSKEDIHNLTEAIKGLEKAAEINVSKDLDNAYEGFISSYRMGAHFMDDGLSPHENETDRLMVFKQAAASKLNVANQDWACLDLSGLKLDGMNFTNCLMEQVNFSGCSLVGVDFTGAILARCNFDGANMSNSILDEATVGGSSLKGSDLSGAHLRETKLSKCQLEDTNFTGANISSPETLEVNINGAIFQSAKIKGWNFLQIEINNSDFSGCQFDTCHFVESKIRGCKFDSAVMPSIAWANCDVSDCSFENAVMNGNCFVLSEENEGGFSYLNFKGADLTRSNLQALNLQGCDFGGSIIESANFSASDLRGVNFNQCNGYQVNLRKANMEGASMVKSSLVEGILSKSKLINTDLSGANLYCVDFMRAVVEGTKFTGTNLDATILEKWRPS